MAQFRTTADILDEILTKAGEPTNGTSNYEADALRYANKVHHAIIAGGSVFSQVVDEAWVWARAKHPIVIELQPAYTSGSCLLTVNDTSITFTVPPSVSLQGWHIQANGKSTVYKIVQHTAGEAAAAIDSSFVDSSGAYSFRAFKLDYEITPTYQIVDSFSDRIDFQESTAATVSATLTHGAYSPAALAAHAAARLTAAGGNTYGAAYDSVLKKTSLSRNTTTAGTYFSMLGAQGPNVRRSALPLLGFDRLNYTADTTYSSTYAPNSVSRLIEPFKLFSNTQQPFIYSTDSIRMQEDFPIALTRERTPERFCRLTEDADGTVWVRFNSYPQFKTKVSIDWIPTPIDLQDNAASVPELPRPDVDRLIDGAAAYVCFDKEDSKWEALFQLCKSGLEAMQKKNRSLLARTGEYFGQIIPRMDYMNPRARLDYGYTSGSSSAGSTSSQVEVLTAVTLDYTSFQSGSTASVVLARTLPASRSIFSIIAKHSTNFTGASISAIAADVGLLADPTYFINGFDVAQAVGPTAQASYVGLYYPAVETGIYVRLTATGANLSALAQGSLVLYMQESIVP